jgi:hypothetical protein
MKNTRPMENADVLAECSIYFGTMRGWPGGNVAVEVLCGRLCLGAGWHSGFKGTQGTGKWAITGGDDVGVVFWANRLVGLPVDRCADKAGDYNIITL